MLEAVQQALTLSFEETSLAFVCISFDIPRFLVPGWLHLELRLNCSSSWQRSSYRGAHADFDSSENNMRTKTFHNFSIWIPMSSCKKWPVCRPCEAQAMPSCLQTRSSGQTRPHQPLSSFSIFLRSCCERYLSPRLMWRHSAWCFGSVGHQRKVVGMLVYNDIWQREREREPQHELVVWGVCIDYLFIYFHVCIV